MDLKQIIIDSLKIDEELKKDLKKLIVLARPGFGDFALPCFSLSKIMRKSPVEIANDLLQNIESEFIEKVEAVNGYVNFYLNKNKITESVLLNEIKVNDNIGEGKIVCIDYSSVNLAKYMHIGHLATTMIGESIARIYESLGYRVVRINYVGDYGTPFGKIIVGYKLWGNEEDLKQRGIDALQEYYVKFCANEEIDPKLMDMAREEFRKIETKEPVTFALYQKIIQIAMDEVKDLTNMLGIQFDDWKGENFYSDKMTPIIEELKNKNLATISENALIVDLNDYGLGVCLIQKSDGTSLYATRDITAVDYRYNEYKFDEMLYVTAIQQKQHFASFFKVVELMGRDYAKNLKHIYYGMFSLPTGKIASRKGKQAIVRDILKEALSRAEEVIKDRNFDESQKNEVVKKVAMGAVTFSVLKNEATKDNVFDLDRALSFEGETAPYMQYTYARCASILRNSNSLNLENVGYNFEALNNETAFSITKLINDYLSFVVMAKEKFDPSVISKYLLDLCALMNKFYHEYKVLDESNLQQTKTRLLLIEKAKAILKTGLKLIAIETIEKM